MSIFKKPPLLVFLQGRFFLYQTSFLLIVCVYLSSPFRIPYLPATVPIFSNDGDVMNILVACDSFKGSLSAQQACSIVAEGIRGARSGWNLKCQPLADGGEGTAEVLVHAGSGDWVEVPDIVGPLRNMIIKSSYAWLPDSGTAIVEMARASGLVLLPVDQRDPWQTTTFGTGQLLAATIARGAKEVLLTLGGSATVDAGTGAACALGWRFLDAKGCPVPLGGCGLIDIRRVEPPLRSLPAISVLCDVTNPLCGPQGAARVFAPQKGATPRQVDQLEAGLENLARIIDHQLGMKLSDFPMGGAAGGFGAGAVAFLGGRLLSGISAVMEEVHFEEQVRWADWVITGEGCLDRTSLQGKVVSGVLESARRCQVPVAVLAGQVQLCQHDLSTAGIDLAMPAMPEGMSVADGLAHARELLGAAASRLAARLDSSP